MATARKDEGRTPYTLGGISSKSNSNEDILDTYQNLETEEASLTEQKEHLETLLGQLEARGKDLVEKRKRRIAKLDSEVSELKRRCEKFAVWINTEAPPECSVAAT